MTDKLERDIWREVALHSDLTHSLPAIWTRLDPFTRPQSIIVRRLSPGADQIQTIASHPTARSSESFRSVALENHDAVLTWLLSDQLMTSHAGQWPADLKELIPPHLEGPLMAGPLVLNKRPVGVLIWHIRHMDLKAQMGHLFRILQGPLAAAVSNHCQNRELKNLQEKTEADNRSLLSRLDRQDISESIIGAETGLKGVCSRIDIVGASDVPVVLLGETGSGKEVVARALHNRSRRAKGPFLRVNCGAIPPELIDTHLFGHERGSFSGAENLTRGWFERADGGTLFLDEIGDLPLQAQVRLLRVLQDGVFERVGGQRPLTVDVRLIAATHRDLQSMVTRGEFREDLWYRIAVFPILIPPLRERPEDIPLLATHFAIKAAKLLGAPPLTPDPAHNRLLMAYDWPGNVRELSAVMERAVILGNGRTLEIAKSLGQEFPGPRSQERGLTGSTRASEPILPLDRAMAKHIEKALAQTGGRIEGKNGAARILGINPHTLRARMRKLGINWRRFRSE